MVVIRFRRRGIIAGGASGAYTEVLSCAGPPILTPSAAGRNPPPIPVRGDRTRP